MANAFDPERAGALDPRSRGLVEKRRKLLGPGYKLFYDKPVEIVRASGVHVYDAEGRAYLDAYNNVPSVGHAHPHVLAAINRQAGTLNTHTRYLDETILAYSERLLATHSEELGSVMYTCTGSEANDLALRIARYNTGGTGIVITTNAYHGLTSALAEISPSLGPRVPLGPHVRTVAPPRSSEHPAAFARRVADAVADLERHGIRLACFIADTLFSSDGLCTEPAGCLRPVLDAVHQAGGLFIADEVQPGFGRTGAFMWGYQRHEVVPDMSTMGKPMGNGMPIAGVACKPALLARFGEEIRYFNTFGGNSVCIAAASAVLDVIEAEGLLENSSRQGELLRDGLTEIARSRDWLGDVRAAGLYAAVDILEPGSLEPSPGRTACIVNAMRERNVLISSTGYPAATLKIRPLLPFSSGDIDRLLATFRAAIEHVENVL